MRLYMAVAVLIAWSLLVATLQHYRDKELWQCKDDLNREASRVLELQMQVDKLKEALDLKNQECFRKVSRVVVNHNNMFHGGIIAMQDCEE